MARTSFTLRTTATAASLRTDVNRTFTDGAIDTGVSATTLTSATAAFNDPLDIGATVVVAGAGSGGADLVTTIASINSATSVELTDAASTTVSGATVELTGLERDGLRADGLQLAPDYIDRDLFFDATSPCYGEVKLSWNITLSTISASPSVTDVVVVYSPFGFPETISSGTVVYEGNDNLEATQTNLPEGFFAYYSLFAHYTSTAGDNYYEKVATVSEIVPANYGNTEAMWQRIPAYYRDLDTRHPDASTSVDTVCLGFDNYGAPVGPLLRFIAIFGFEMDRMMSILIHTSRSKDPRYADAESLSYLADETGTVVSAGDLGYVRLRNFLNEIGLFRRSKGTLYGTEYFIRALTGSNAEVNTTTRAIAVDATRINRIVDPQNNKSQVDIETTTAAEFGEAESAAYVAKAFPSSASFPVSALLAEGQIAVAAPGFENCGTMSGVGAPVYTNVTEVAGPTVYSPPLDPDVTIPTGHMFAVVDDSNSTNAVNISISGTELDEASGSYSTAYVVGGVFILTDDTTNSCEIITLGETSDYFRIYLNQSDDSVRFTYDRGSGTADTLVWDPTGYLDVPLYAIGYFDPSDDTVHFEVYDSSGLVFSDSEPRDTTGTMNPDNLRFAEHSGGVEMIHASNGAHAEAVWANRALIANEWLNGSRTTTGGTVYNLDSPFAVVEGDVVTFSIHSGVGVFGNIAWARLVDEATGLITYGYQDTPSIRNGVPYFSIRATGAATVNIEYMTYDDAILDNTLYLAEVGTVGGYFDGDTVRGGWLLGVSNISDYDWAGTAHNSVSIYNEDGERTRQILSLLYPEVLPIDVADLYSISFNN